MGLAPYGKPKYVKTILKDIIKIRRDGSYKLNMDLFNYETGLTMINEKFEKTFQIPMRKKKDLITQFHKDIASSVQFITRKCFKSHKYAKSKYSKKIYASWWCST